MLFAHKNRERERKTERGGERERESEWVRLLGTKRVEFVLIEEGKEKNN